MWVFNDAEFTKEDWDNIESLSQSMKESDPLKVGKFGLGFNSVYHVTGNPRFTVLCFTLFNITYLPKSVFDD